MKALIPLIWSVCKHFSLHPARFETLSCMIFGLIQSGNVHQVSLSHYLGSSTPKSAVRRVERFFQHQFLCFSKYALSIVYFLQFSEKFELCLDRTNWKFGTKNINYLVLSWRINAQISLPLFASELNKAGNSNTQERIDLLKKFDETFGFKRIGSLLADREFIGEKWIKLLISEDIPFFIRVKENTRVPFDTNPVHVGTFFKHLQRHHARIIEKEIYGAQLYFAATPAKNKDMVIVMSNQNWKPKRILNAYRRRWSIEEMFKKIKTSGLNWENTHMKYSNRLINLLIILSVASLLIYCMGNALKTTWKKTLNCPLWSLFKKGLLIFRHTLGKSIKSAINLIKTALENPKIIWKYQK